MKKIDKKKAGIAIAAVPVIAAGTVAMVSAYKQGMEFTPTNGRKDFQANKVVFENDENALEHQDSASDEESRLLQQKNSEQNQGADLQNQADYLFEDQKVQQETGNETTVGIDEEQNGEETKKSDGAPTTELQNPQQNQPDETYHVTENPSDADVTIRGNDGTIPAGNNNGNTNGNTDGDRNGTTTPSSSGTQDPSVSHIASMLITGSSMGIVEAIQKYRQYEDADPKIRDLMDKLRKFEEYNMEKLKDFL